MTDINLLKKPLMHMRQIGILLNCNVCTKLTQCDPFPKFLFGVCCKECYQSLLLSYSAWIEDNYLEKSDNNLKVFLDMIKNQVKKD